MTITSGLSGTGGVQQLTQTPVEEHIATSHQPPTISPGTGAMQGTMVGVGDGEDRLALLEDSESSRGMFSRVLGFMGNVLSAAHEFVGQMSMPEDFAAQDPESEDDIDDEVDIGARSVSSPDDDDEELAVDDESSVVGNRVGGHKDPAYIDETGNKFFQVDEEDVDEVDVDDDNTEFFDCEGPEPEFDQLFSGVDGGDTVTKIDDDDGSGDLGVDDDNGDERGLGRALRDDTSQSRSVGEPQTGRLAEVPDDLDIPIVSISALLSGDELLQLDVGDKEVRDASETQIKEQQVGVMGRLASWAGWAAVNVASGVVTVAKGAYNMLPTAVTGESSVQPKSDVSSVQAPKKLVDRNLEQADKTAHDIRARMHKLNKQLEKMGHGELVKDGSVPKEQLDEPELTFADNSFRWYHQARGALSAVLPTLGFAAAGAGVAAVGDAAGTLTGSLPLKAFSLLGGGFVGLTALAQYPELANNKAAISLIMNELGHVQKDMDKLDDIMGQERARQTATARAMVVANARTPQLEAMRTELEDINTALEKIEAGEVTGPPPLTHKVELGDGKERTQTLSLAARTRDAFSSFFSSIGRGLAGIGHAITDLPNVVNRFFESRAAGKAEQAYAQGAESMLRELAKAGEKSQLEGGKDVRARERAEANGAKIETREVRRQFHMGENLSRALIKQEGQSFGTVAYRAGSDPYAVSATLTTARAMAWYLDAIAPSEGSDDPEAPTPKVTRNPDGSLTINDPDRKLYSFLMNVPVAHVSTTTGADGQQSLAFEIDDHRQGMPQGMHGMRFETRLDADGNEQLHLSFTPKKTEPVFDPLGNESEMLMKMYDALHSTGTTAQTDQPKRDLSGWPEDSLRMRQAELTTALERDIALIRGDQAQVAALEDWHNPAFFSGRV